MATGATPPAARLGPTTKRELPGIAGRPGWPRRRKLHPQGGSISVLVETREGRNGGTWAHWQIAANYAQYLDPVFNIQWNEWAMERVQQLGGKPIDEQAAMEAKLQRLRDGPPVNAVQGFANLMGFLTGREFKIIRVEGNADIDDLQ